MLSFGLMIVIMPSAVMINVIILSVMSSKIAAFVKTQLNCFQKHFVVVALIKTFTIVYFANCTKLACLSTLGSCILVV